MAVDSAGNVFVADYGNNRAQKFAGDGLFLSAWGTAGTGAGQFTNPIGITVGSLGTAYVVDNGNSRVEAFALVSQLSLSGSAGGHMVVL